LSQADFQIFLANFQHLTLRNKGMESIPLQFAIFVNLTSKRIKRFSKLLREAKKAQQNPKPGEKKLARSVHL